MCLCREFVCLHMSSGKHRSLWIMFKDSLKARSCRLRWSWRRSSLSFHCLADVLTCKPWSVSPVDWLNDVWAQWIISDWDLGNPVTLMANSHLSLAWWAFRLGLSLPVGGVCQLVAVTLRRTCTVSRAGWDCYFPSFLCCWSWAKWEEPPSQVPAEKTVNKLHMQPRFFFWYSWGGWRRGQQ